MSRATKSKAIGKVEGQWKGPDPLLTSGRGCVCIFPQDADSPIWILDRLIHLVTVPQALGSSTATTTEKRKGTPMPLPPPATTAAQNSRGPGAMGGASPAARTQCVALTAGGPPLGPRPV